MTRNVPLTLTEIADVRDMADRERVGHLNRMADWVLRANDTTRDEMARAQAQVNALASAREAEKCIRLRAKFQHVLTDDDEGNS